ncbi:uncharacterized protein [Dermacentor albipictus]|uniref:uncharacterized protein n=1 Tax=Dermacentor albipictus TaxID=60249 RepID=UPI0031FD8A66
MQRTQQLLLLLCVFVGGFIVGTQYRLNVSHGRDSPGQQQRRRRPSTTVQKTVRVSPYITADGPEWADAWVKASANVHLYSAYFDPRLGANATVVRVLGLMRLNPRLKVNCSCLIDDRPEKPAQPVVAEVEYLQDHHNAKYDGVFINCPYYASNDSETPRTVRVTVTGAEAGTSARIPVHYRERSPSAQELASLALCVRPFYGGVPKVHDLMHFLAYYSHHGVQRFTFYADTSSQEVNKYLWTLRDRLKIDFFAWSLPAAKKSWALAQSVFTQDCLYRHMNASRRVLIVDLDEFVFPLPVRGRPRTIAELVATLPAHKTCLVVRNVFWIRATSRIDRPFIFASLNRSLHVWPMGIRSKYFADPLGVLEGGIHFCRRFVVVGGRSIDKQDWVRQALLYHYRIGYRSVSKEKFARDTSMLVWKEPVMASPLIAKPDFWRSAAYKVHDGLWNSFDVVLRLVRRNYKGVL